MTDTNLSSKQRAEYRNGLALRLQEWSRNCLIDGLKMDKGEPTLQVLLKEAVTLLLADETTTPIPHARRVITEISAERERQIQCERWLPSHDDQHTDCELSAAAACYAAHNSGGFGIHDYDDNGVPKQWPWAPEWWKPKDPRRDLIRAAALLVAEIERSDRAEGMRPEEPTVANVTCNSCGQSYVATLGHVCPAYTPEKASGEPPGLICNKCGVDRFKATCPNRFVNCPMHGTTQQVNGDGDAKI